MDDVQHLTRRADGALARVSQSLHGQRVAELHPGSFLRIIDGQFGRRVHVPNSPLFECDHHAVYCATRHARVNVWVVNAEL